MENMVHSVAGKNILFVDDECTSPANRFRLFMKSFCFDTKYYESHLVLQFMCTAWFHRSLFYTPENISPKTTNKLPINTSKN